MSKKFTDEEFEKALAIWRVNKEEFKKWAETHGVMHSEKWLGENRPGFDPEFTYYIVTKFIEWQMMRKRTRSLISTYRFRNQ